LLPKTPKPHKKCDLIKLIDYFKICQNSEPRVVSSV